MQDRPNNMRLPGLVFFLLTIASQSSFGAYSFVQKAASCCGNPTTITLGSFPAANNLLVAASLILQEPTHHVVSVTGGGATWAKAVSSNVTADVEVWYGVVTGAPSKTVVITYDSAPHLAEGFVMEFHESGGTPGGVDQTGSSSSSGSPINSGSVTTTAAADLVIGVAGRGSGGSNYTGGPDNSFTRLSGNGTGDAIQVAYQIETATGTFGTSWTYGGGNADGVIVAFLPAVTSGSAFVPANIY
jgi:hypothetical protein